ncbi:hypothetical protein RBH29_16670 [Herbivorax sp. ANBcel31]|uniref:hypothetical protein n=1 Tax=Herbivorax sp. ANBcel31 TaxID=3069754 RepID=UPI0027AECB3B|nr:hypothetical protein [Herbivorax sp. ANBcel31]MDQ2088063.1 hypothetical protein [Herbivorax sp. ANBcel31]
MKKICKSCGAANQGVARYCYGCSASLNNSLPKNENTEYKLSPSGNNVYVVDDTVSLGMWMLIIILNGIPILNIFVMIYLAVFSENENLKNYGKAGSILIGIALAFAIMLKACS